MHIDLIKALNFRIRGFFSLKISQNGSIDFRNDFNRMINKIIKVLFDKFAVKINLNI